MCALNARLDAPLTFELKRELVETLIEGIRVDTLIEGRQRDLQVAIAYRFAAPTAAPPGGGASDTSIRPFMACSSG